MSEKSEKIDDSDFNGFYNPNVDISVKNGKVSANYNFYASEEEKQAYKEKYGVTYPYMTSAEFRRFVYNYLMWYMDDFVKKANNGDIESLKESPLWRAIDSFIAVFTVAAGAYGLYDAITCCKKIHEQISIFLTVKIVKETGKLLRKIVVEFKDNADNFTNPKQDRLIDNITENIINALIAGENVNLKTIYTRDYDINHPERAKQSSFLMNNNIAPDIFDLGGYDTVVVEWSGLMDIPLIDGVKLNGGDNSSDDLYLQNSLRTVNQFIPLIEGGVVWDELITLDNGMSRDNKGITDIRNKYTLGEGLRFRDDGRTFQLAVNQTHFRPQSIKGYHIKQGSVKKENLTINSVDEGNIEDNSVEERHLSDEPVFKGLIFKNNCLQARHIVDYSVAGDKIQSISNQNINASISQNIRRDVQRNLNLGVLKDFQGQTNVDSVHFTKEHREKLKKIRIFNNKTEANGDVDIYIDNPGNVYKLSLSNHYFRNYENTLSKVERKANPIAEGLDDIGQRYTRIFSELKGQHDKNSVSLERQFTGHINIDTLGSVCKLSGEIQLLAAINVEKPIKVGRVTNYNFRSFRKICTTLLDGYKNYLVFLSFKDGEIIIEKAVDSEGKQVKTLNTLTNKFTFNFEYIHVA